MVRFNRFFNGLSHYLSDDIKNKLLYNIVHFGFVDNITKFRNLACDPNHFLDRFWLKTIMPILSICYMV